MWNRKSNSENGQAIVLIVLAVVALIGFLTLSIDVGQAYSERRRAQNASDAAALAGAENVSQKIKGKTNLNFDCTSEITTYSGWYQAANSAILNAQGNGFVIDPATGVINDLGGGRKSVTYGIDDKNGVEFICDPAPYVDVHVQLTSKVNTSFLHFISPSSLVNTVDTVVRVRPQTVYGNGAAILALKTSCDHTQKNGGIFFDGKVSVDVTGGDMISNACLDKNGSSGNIEAKPNKITYRTDVEPVKKDGTIDGMDPQPTKSTTIVGVDWPTLANKLSNECKLLSDYTSPVSISAKKGSVTYGPGNYSDIDVDSTLNLTAGLYCITGTTNIKGTLVATDVTLFIPDSGGAFTIGASGNATILAAKTGCEYDTPPTCEHVIGGLAILYLPDDDVSNKNQLSLQGNSKSTYRGSIIAPKTIIDIGGNPGADTINSQIIGETIRIHGNGTLNVNYLKDYELALPAFLDLNK